jgi:hypothetical protein
MSDLFAEREIDAAGVRRAPWVRRWVLCLFAAFALLALLNVFGQRPKDSSAATPAAVLRLNAPEAVRGGLFFQARVDVRAVQALEHPRLVLDRGWLEGMQVNSTEPDPMSEATRDGRVVLSYDALDAGDTLTVWMQFEVNPTNRGRHAYGVELDDAEQRVARIDRRITIFP